jgi:hypothetical protein
MRGDSTKSTHEIGVKHLKELEGARDLGKQRREHRAVLRMERIALAKAASEQRENLYHALALVDRG